MGYGGTILIPRSPHGVELNIKIHKTRVLLVLLYGCRTWSLGVREEYGSRVFGEQRSEIKIWR
jgi:hypothetical protein